MINRKTFQKTLLAGALALLTLSANADDAQDVSRLIKAGKVEEAMQRVDSLLVAKPRDAQLRFLKGLIYAEQGKQADAIGTFLKITEDYPELPEPYNNLAVLYAAQGQYDKARAALEMAIRTHPSYATAHENLGDIYAKLASEAYSKALQLDGNNSGAQVKLSMLKELIGSGVRPKTPVAASASAAPAARNGKAAPPIPPIAATPAAKSTPDATAATAMPSVPQADDNSASPQSSADIAAVTKVVDDWAQAWSHKDIAAYMAFYAPNFQLPSGVTRAQWEDDRRAKIEGKRSIAVKVEALTVKVEGANAVAKFRQHYRGGPINSKSAKTLALVKTDGKWLIQNEDSGS